MSGQSASLRTESHWEGTVCRLTICGHKSGDLSESLKIGAGVLCLRSVGPWHFSFPARTWWAQLQAHERDFSDSGLGEVKTQPVQSRPTALALHNNYQHPGCPLEGRFIMCALQFWLAGVLFKPLPLARLWQSCCTLSCLSLAVISSVVFFLHSIQWGL